MRNNATLKSVLNRQCITLGMGRPVARGLFTCQREGGIGTTEPTVTLKPFERVFRLSERSPQAALQTP